MTARDIAAATGKTERAVQMWAKKTGESISPIGEKISSVQKTGKPADYTLDEACQIIETGMGPAAAGVYRANAAQAKPAAAPKLRLPSGAQLNALRHIYPAADLCKRLDYLLGYPLAPIDGKLYAPAETPETPENPIDRALMATGLQHIGAAARLTPAAWDAARRTAIAAGQRSLNDAAARIAAERKQGRLIP